MKKHITTLLSLLLLAFTSLAQQQTLSLNVYNGQSEIKAPLSVTLTDGFHIPAGNNTRIYTTGLSLQNCFSLTSTPNIRKNYILTTTFKEPGLSPDGQNYTACQINQTIDYIDGLGRPLQSIAIKASPLGGDIITPFAYDAFGREPVKYQPYTQIDNNGAYRPLALAEQASFYNSPPTGIVQTPNPYATTVFELSPLNRAIEQGAPGTIWQPVPNSLNGHTLKTEYSVNVENEVKCWIINSDNEVTASVYQPGKLYKTVLKDENWRPVDLKMGTTEEFKDQNGRVVLKQIWETNTRSLSTYYVYDDLGNLRYVLPPAVNVNGQNPINSFKETDLVFDQFIYGYHYDNRKRITEKKIPGKAWEYIVYNKLDQVVLTQDGNQRNKTPQEWIYNKYDLFGRLVITGLYNHVGTVADNGTNPQRTSKDALQNTLNSQAELIANGDVSISLWETRNGTDYDGRSFPQNGGEQMTVNYYDNYDFTDNTFGQPVGNQAPKERVKGLLTGAKVKNLGTGQMLLTVNYYDLEGRLLQSKKEHQVNGNDVINNVWNFDGSLKNSTRTHTANGITTTIANRYEYDHVGRKAATFENINDKGEITLNHIEYNEIGQLSKKSLHNDVQATTFAYNERGWMKNSTSNQFSLKLEYEDGIAQGYNGNITKQSWDWTSSINPTANTFSYGYDRLNRLASAGTTAGVPMSELITYDAMGNITSLKRDDDGIKTYNYYNLGNSNKLKSVGGLTVQDYEYDANGNSVKDGANGFSLTYNYLNLPITASKTTDTPVSLSYIYDATGNKLARSSNGSVRSYVKGIEYGADGKIDIIHTEEGVAQNDGNGTFIYHYNLSDHLGNVRYTFKITGSTVEPLQKDDYYAFGKRKTSMLGSTNNKYLYNNKELQEELGQYDYGARFYDPIIGRFNVIDPLSEKSRADNPYGYALNNPIRFIDVDGMYAAPPTDFLDENGKLIKHVEDGSTAAFQQTGKGYFNTYEFLGFNTTLSEIPYAAKNTVNLTTAIEEQQNLNMENPYLKPIIDANGKKTTFCNYATQNILNMIETATDRSTGISMNGTANTMTGEFANNSLLQSTDKATAISNAQSGGLSLLAYKNPTGPHGHVASLSVGGNAGKGEIANIGSQNGFLPIGPKGKGHVFGDESSKSVKYYTLSPLVTPKTLDTPKPPIIGTFKLY